MATPMRRDQFEQFTALEVALRTVFLDQMTSNDPLWTLYNVRSSARAVERNHGVSGMSDVPEYTGAIEYDSFEPLYRADYTHSEYAKGMAAERKLLDDDEYGVLARRAEMMGISFDRTATKHAASVFNNAFSSSYTGPDSVALCSDSHPYSPTNSSTQDNAGTSALSHDAVIATRQAMMRFEDSKENPAVAMPDTLVVPIELVDTARVIVESTQRSGVANNDTNVNQGYNIVTSPFLTDTNNWFMVDSRMARMYLNWFWRVRPEFAQDPTSDFNLQLRYRGYMRYSFGWDHWTWIYGHAVT